MSVGTKIANTAYALYQAVVVSVIIEKYELVAPAYVFWLGLVVFITGLYTMPRIMKSKYAVGIFVFALLVFGGWSMFEEILFGLTCVWVFDELLHHEWFVWKLQDDYLTKGRMGYSSSIIQNSSTNLINHNNMSAYNSGSFDDEDDLNVDLWDWFDDPAYHFLPCNIYHNKI